MWLVALVVTLWTVGHFVISFRIVVSDIFVSVFNVRPLGPLDVHVKDC